MTRVPLKKLHPAPWNPREIRSDRFKNLCASIEADPGLLELRPILATKDGTIYGGNHRYRAVQHLGWTDVPAVLSDIPEQLAKERGMRDNGAWADWQDESLGTLLAELKASGSDIDLLGFDSPELDRLLAGVTQLPEEDEADLEPPAEPITRPGDLWILGGHRLLCGDSTKAEELARALNGATPSLLHTDPPYGINIVSPKGEGFASAGQVGGSKPFGATSGTTRRSSTGFDAPSAAARRGTGLDGPTSRNQIIQSNTYPVMHGDDAPFDPAPWLGMAPVVILWGANYFADELPPSSCWLCWDKREGIVRNNFADCELAWCSKPAPSRVFHHLWNGLHKGSQHDERRTHPTEKPIALFEEIGRLYAPTGVWLDPYAGTGAQLLAAERVGTTAVLLEYEPGYCDVIVRRWERLTGKTAVLAKAD